MRGKMSRSGQRSGEIPRPVREKKGRVKVSATDLCLPGKVRVPCQRALSQKFGFTLGEPQGAELDAVTVSLKFSGEVA